MGDSVFKKIRELKCSVLLCLQIKVIFWAIVVSSGPFQYNGLLFGFKKEENPWHDTTWMNLDEVLSGISSHKKINKEMRSNAQHKKVAW